MNIPKQKIKELAFVVGAVSLSAAVAIYIVWGWDYFVSNFLHMWLPQLVIFIGLATVRARWSVVGGAALATALYLVLFYFYFIHNRGGNGLEWLGYWFSLPGAAIGSAIAVVMFRRETTRTFSSAAFVAFALTVGGIALNQSILCMSVFYCGR